MLTDTTKNAALVFACVAAVVVTVAGCSDSSTNHAGPSASPSASTYDVEPAEGPQQDCPKWSDMAREYLIDRPIRNPGTIQQNDAISMVDGFMSRCRDKLQLPEGMSAANWTGATITDYACDSASAITVIDQMRVLLTLNRYIDRYNNDFNAIQCNNGKLKSFNDEQLTSLYPDYGPQPG